MLFTCPALLLADRQPQEQWQHPSILDLWGSITDLRDQILNSTYAMVSMCPNVEKQSFYSIHICPSNPFVGDFSCPSSVIHKLCHFPVCFLFLTWLLYWDRNRVFSNYTYLK